MPSAIALKPGLAVLGALLAFLLVPATPAQAHSITCASTRLVAVEAAEDVSAHAVQTASCAPGPGSRVRGVFHRHLVTWNMSIAIGLVSCDFRVTVRWTPKPTPHLETGVFKAVSCHG
jgi:hypothetical protein